jgi:hypothetical protein
MKRFFFLIITLMLISCQKESLSLTGTVQINFINLGITKYTEIEPQIFIIENVKMPLLDILHVNSKGETEKIELNYGDYYLTYRIMASDNSYSYRSKIFQVKAGQVSNLIVDFTKE